MPNPQDAQENGSNPMLIILLTVGALFALVYLGSQSSQGNSSFSPSSIISSLTKN